MPNAQLLTGDALTVLRTLSDGAVRCCVTSPPYWGLRDYGMDGQLGLEATPEEYVARMVDVFREVRRALANDGTLWLNIGDSYAQAGGAGWQGKNGQRADHRFTVQRLRDIGRQPPNGIKAKDLVGIPWMLAFALRADGWYLRSEIIWAKPNPMPESVRDRPTKSHEQIFLLSKEAQYYYDAVAIAEPVGLNTHARLSQDLARQRGSFRANGGTRIERPFKAVGNVAERNSRTIWTIASQSYTGAHFATFPNELARRCILAGSSQYGQCPLCGKPWVRIVERTSMVVARSQRTHEKGRTRSSGTMLEPPSSQTTGWMPSCDHGETPTPDTVLDPFSGSGTTAAVAIAHGRRAIGIELNPEYQELARHRIGPLLVESIG